MSKMKLNKFAVEIIQLFKGKGLPAYILSGSEKSLIELFLASQGLGDLVTDVIANQTVRD
jgi:2,3-diketo-5-methylthio-1-phosphopentane phosphatase